MQPSGPTSAAVEREEGGGRGLPERERCRLENDADWTPEGAITGSQGMAWGQ